MPESSFGPLRIWDGDPPSARGSAPLAIDRPDDLASLHLLAQTLAAQEILRAPLSNPESTEPLSLQWYLELEHIRHTRQGKWIPSLLEFGKHQGDRLLGLGVALGSDLVQYARNGAEVLAVCSSTEQLALVRRNFELRGLPGTFLHGGPTALPLEPASIDVAVITGLLHELNDPATVVEEVYRVLKPGGKVLAVVPARFDIDYWSGLFYYFPRRQGGDHSPVFLSSASLLSVDAHRFCSRDLKQLFHRFHEHRLWKRHLRRVEVPHLWRWLPLGLLERLTGRLLVLKGFKPVSAARFEQAAA